MLALAVGCGEQTIATIEDDLDAKAAEADPAVKDVECDDYPEDQVPAEGERLTCLAYNNDNEVQYLKDQVGEVSFVVGQDSVRVRRCNSRQTPGPGPEC